jgi:hypothetical protein
MKKKIFLASFLLILSGAVFAQDFSIKGGFALANYHATGWSSSQKAKLGFLAGLGIEAGGPNVFLEVNFLYFQKGCKTTYSAGVENKFLLPVISAPVLLKLKMSSKSTSPFVCLGGEVGYVLSSKIQGPGGVTTHGIPALVKRWDYGLVGGGGVELWLQNFGLILEGRYHYGLANLGTTQEFHFKTSALALMVGMMF